MNGNDAEKSILELLWYMLEFQKLCASFAGVVFFFEIENCNEKLSPLYDNPVSLIWLANINALYLLSTEHWADRMSLLHLQIEIDSVNELRIF